MDIEWELRAREAVFTWLANLEREHPDSLPARPLQEGIDVDGHRIRILGSGAGIFKPASLGAALSVMTTAPRSGREAPYEDHWIDEARLSYAYQGTDPDLWTNQAMRAAWEYGLPLVYLHGVRKGRYLTEYPVYVTADRPKDLFVDLIIGARDGERSIGIELDGRRYASRAARTRLHQRGFRDRVLTAYRGTCALCGLRHPSLLDAAHIVPDTEPTGIAITPNGLALCKIHHAAYDQLFIGISPDLVVEVNEELLEERDGPMLRHGIQELHRQRLRVVPAGRYDRPDRDRLEWRYTQFRVGSTSQ